MMEQDDAETVMWQGRFITAKTRGKWEYVSRARGIKAGVILVAVIAPAFQDTDIWKPLGLSFGLVTMVWGAVGALRHVDAKLILAWGTVSQLGLLITLLNLVAGLAIGVAMHGMPFGLALETYAVLTVGDGLVTQIPAVIISIAAAMPACGP